jgi:hypothetical protein
MMFADFIPPGFLRRGASLLVAAGKVEIAGVSLFSRREGENNSGAQTRRGAGRKGILFAPLVQFVS